MKTKKKLSKIIFFLIGDKFNEIGFNEIEITNFKSGSLNLMINVRA